MRLITWFIITAVFVVISQSTGMNPERKTISSCNGFL